MIVGAPLACSGLGQVRPAGRRRDHWQKREVDFLVVRDRKPWFLVEVKVSDRALSPAVAYFQQQTRAPHAFQVVLEMPYVDADCFARHEAVVVPARTLLSQLL